MFTNWALLSIFKKKRHKPIYGSIRKAFSLLITEEPTATSQVEVFLYNLVVLITEKWWQVKSTLTQLQVRCLNKSRDIF